MDEKTAIRILQNKVVRLEGRLADANKFIFEMGKNYETFASDSRKREAVLREALEEILTCARSWDCRATARAALEVK